MQRILGNKTPTLRNIEITGPYMHDGRFNTIDEVLEHYQSGVHASETVDPSLLHHKTSRFSDVEREALLLFLKTLTDEKYH
jgi:cytochrome c peroxidase